jgi:K+-transporting ATPase ATPase C chain
MQLPSAAARESTLSHLITSVIYTVVTVIALGFVFPIVIGAIGGALFPSQAGGSLITSDGKVTSALDQTAVLPRPPVGRGQGLRPDVDRRHQPRSDIEETARRR